MNYFNDNFAKLLDPYPVIDLSAMHSSVYGIDDEFRLACTNSAWIAFARENGGDLDSSSFWGGRSILDAMTPVTREFYEQRYRTCMNSGQKWQHEYECSAPEKYRRFHQVAYPLSGGQGLLLVNALILERPHDAERARPEGAQLSDYLDQYGFVTQCAHCRQVQNFSDALAQRWDWIPEWVSHPPGNTSHTFCPGCYGHYYGSLSPTTAKQSAA